MATIVLADGTTLSNLTVNGDNFISNVELTEDIFENNMSPVTIDTDDEHMIHDHMDLVQIVHWKENEWWFVLRDLTQQELNDAKTRADIDFIAMMTDVDLPEEEDGEEE